MVSVKWVELLSLLENPSRLLENALALGGVGDGLGLLQ